MPRRNSLSSSTVDATLLFLGLLVVYLLNGGLIILADSIANSYLPLSVLEEGNLSYTPDEFPFLFGWEVAAPQGPLKLVITNLSPLVNELRDEGILKVSREHYNLVPSSRPGLYVNTFGPGAGLTALPAVAAVKLFVGDLRDRRWLLALICRVVSSACVAGSAALVYLTAARFVTRSQALTLAIAYGIGTCVWVISTASLTQHGPNELYLSLGTYALARAQGARRWLAIAGIAYSAAVVCRPTSGVVVVAVGVYLLVTDWRGAFVFAAACCPLLLFLASYNNYYLGSPFTFGQTVQARTYLEREFGSTNAWRTPFFTGFFGLLISPSRGVLIFSPWLVLAMAGAVAVWRRAEYGWVRPLTIAAGVIAVMQCKWFDWWGGWCYGYRPLVDILPLAVLFALPLLAVVWRQHWLGAAMCVLLVWSIFVQGLGAWAFDMDGWNARRGFAVQVPNQEQSIYTVSRTDADELAQLAGGRPQPAILNIDFPPHNARLWSLSDNQIGYYLSHFAESRAARRNHAKTQAWIVGRNPAITHFRLAIALNELGRSDAAIEEYQAAIRLRPGMATAHLNLGRVFADRREFTAAAAAFQKAIELEPQAILAHENLAIVLAREGKHTEAISQLKQCLALDPNSPQSHYLYAESLMALGDDAAAVEEYRTVLKLASNHGDAVRGIAWVLATTADSQLRNPREAWNLSQRLIAATQSRDALILDTAAAAAAALSRYDDAVRLAESALGLPPAATIDPQQTQAIRERLELYRQHQPYVRPRPRVDNP